MTVIKRDGREAHIDLNKIQRRLEYLVSLTPVLDAVDILVVTQKVVADVVDGIATERLDQIAADICQAMMIQDPQYAALGARILVSNAHKNMRIYTKLRNAAGYAEADARGITTEQREYRTACMVIWELLHGAGRLNDAWWAKAKKIAPGLDMDRDYNVSLFGLQTLDRGYLQKTVIGGRTVCETQQMMCARVAIGMHDTAELVQAAYDSMSKGYYTHATPTLFNIGTKNEQLSSCFLMAPEDDILSILKLNADCGITSKGGGGMGMGISDIRCEGSHIEGTNGKSTGILKMIQMYQATVNYINQGGKRKGSIAMYLEPHHYDVLRFLEMRKPNRAEDLAARDVFTALWVSDLFMETVARGETWFLMDPKVCPGLTTAFGDAYKTLYHEYVDAGKYIKAVSAIDLWNQILTAQAETGMPYISFKDAVNRKNNQAHLGTITHSNLCNEITLFSNSKEYAVCNLASLALPRFVTDGPDEPSFDYDLLGAKVEELVVNLNRVIDRNTYPAAEAKLSNTRHRPIGIGVQGLADTFMKMGLPFETTDQSAPHPQTRLINRQIFETISYHAYLASARLARDEGTYPSYPGSPASKGILQIDMWAAERDGIRKELDWQPVRDAVRAHGLRNSVLTALMPTASTAQILGNNEAFEPFTSNFYMRQTMGGEFPMVNQWLVEDLRALGLWDARMVAAILQADGSVQNIARVPEALKHKYRTVWEIKQRNLITLGLERGPFVDQTQSFNLFLATPTHASLSSALFMQWRGGAKTGMYYLRSQATGQGMKVVDKPKADLAKADLAKADLAKADLAKADLAGKPPVKDCADDETCDFCAS